MLRNFWRLFPLFIVQKIALKHCQRYQLGKYMVVEPFKGVMFEDVVHTPKEEFPYVETDSHNRVISVKLSKVYDTDRMPWIGELPKVGSILTDKQLKKQYK